MYFNKPYISHTAKYKTSLTKNVTEPQTKNIYLLTKLYKCSVHTARHSSVNQTRKLRMQLPPSRYRNLFLKNTHVLATLTRTCPYKFTVYTGAAFVLFVVKNNLSFVILFISTTCCFSRVEQTFVFLRISNGIEVEMIVFYLCL